VFTRHIGDNMSGEWMRLFTTSTSGGRQKQVTSGRAGNEGVLSKPRFDSLGTFSPDGKQIAYSQEDGTFDGEQLQHLTIDVMKPDGSGSRAVTKLKDYSGGVTGIGWSPDGTRLVYGFERRDNGGSALFVVSTDGTGTRRLTDWTLGAGGTPAWSPKGDVIVFRAVEDEDSGIGNLYAIRADGSGLTRITDFRNEVISHIVSFSPDGRWIASSSGPAHGTTDMFIARPDGSRMRVVARTPKTSESGPTWAPRG
jgi:TolB protein